MKCASYIAVFAVGASCLLPRDLLAQNAQGVSSAMAPMAAAPTPPPGWEVQPPASPPASSTGKEKPAPSCCAFDTTCCSRQTDIDNFVPPIKTQTFDIKLADLLDAVVKEAPKDGPYIEGVADVHIIDGTGRPFPWPDGPKAWEIRITPPGKLGDIKFMREWTSPYFDDMEYRGMGAGTMRTIQETPDKGRSLITGPIEFWTFNRGENGRIIHEQVKGKLEGSPKVLASYWLRAEAIDLAEGVVFGYRGMHEGQPHAFFVLPEVLLGFESKDAKTTGGFFRSRFSSAFPYTVYRFPIGSGRSNMINCTLRDFEVRRWFERPKDSKPFPESTAIVIAMSQTSVERDPKLRILFF